MKSKNLYSNTFKLKTVIVIINSLFFMNDFERQKHEIFADGSQSTEC